jgi:hypothetical protein
VSNSTIDQAVKKALSEKKSFNEKKYVREVLEKGGVGGEILEEKLEVCQI